MQDATGAFGRPDGQHADLSFDARCRNFVYEFYDHYDRAEYTKLVDMFVPNGFWFRANKQLCGRSEILSAVRERPITRRSLHSICNLQVHPAGPVSGSVRYWLTVYRSDDAPALDEPACIDAPTMILSGSGDIVLVDGVMLFARKSLKREFLFNPR